MQIKPIHGEPHGANVVALHRPHATADLHCFAAPSCPLRQAVPYNAEEIVSAIYALITSKGDIFRGAQNIHADQLGDLMRAIDLLALQIHEVYDESLHRELAAEAAEARGKGRKAL